MKEKLLEIIQAGAIGDAFGYQVEFDKIDTIKQKYGIFGIKYEESNLEKDASDDTQMTLFCFTRSALRWYHRTFLHSVHCL